MSDPYDALERIRDTAYEDIPPSYRLEQIQKAAEEALESRAKSCNRCNRPIASALFDNLCERCEPEVRATKARQEAEGYPDIDAIRKILKKTFDEFECLVSFTYYANGPGGAAEQFIDNLAEADWFIGVRNTRTGERFTYDTETGDIDSG